MSLALPPLRVRSSIEEDTNNVNTSSFLFFGYIHVLLFAAPVKLPWEYTRGWLHALKAGRS